MPIAATATSTALDLSQLPAPDVVTQLPYETILQELMGHMVLLYPAIGLRLESEPIRKLIQLFAYREMLLRRKFNDAAKGCFIAFAGGGDLEHLAAFFNVARLTILPADPDTGEPAVMEEDDDLRRRIILAPDSWSVAGPESAYVFHALSADADIADASATSPAPCEVVVAVLPRIGATTPTPDLVAAVEAVVNSDGLRPLTDQVTVQAGALSNYAVNADLILFPGPDAETIMNAARASLDAFCLRSRKLGRDVPRSAIIAAIHVEGVKQVVLNAPLADIVCSPTQAPHNDAITLTLAGYD